MVGALIPFIFMYVLCVLQNRGGALIVVPQMGWGCFLSLWSTGRSGGGRLERLAHVLKLADRHVDGNVENVDGEALQSAERVVETLKEKRKEVWGTGVGCVPSFSVRCTYQSWGQSFLSQLLR